MKNKNGYRPPSTFPNSTNQRLSLLSFWIVLTALFICGRDLFWHDNEYLLIYFFALYAAALVSFALSGYSFLRFGLALSTGGLTGILLGYFIGYLVNHYYPVQDGPGMAPNFTDVFRLFLGIINGLSAGLVTAALIINRLRSIRQNTRQIDRPAAHTPPSA
jgi:hypothetical protein